jgi:hypothetical protein
VTRRRKPAPNALDLEVVDGRTLPAAARAALRPGVLVRDGGGVVRRLPRFFYVVPSWARALEVELAPGFALWEFVHTDVREAPALRGFPRYVPCAVTLLAAHLAVLRAHLGTTVRLSANGAHRSPAHERNGGVLTPHQWGTAADLVRVGATWLADAKAVEEVQEAVRAVLPGVWTRPFGEGPGHTDDHLHLDLGYVTLDPPGLGADADAEPDEAPDAP